MMGVFYFVLYFFVNVLTLGRFPFVHSDEAWLGGLSRAYLLQGTPYTTESFFDLMPRNPHLIKVFFHYMQAVFIKFFNYRVFSVRIVSLIFGMFFLIVMKKIIEKINNEKLEVLSIFILCSLNIQFIYAFHFGRQEAIMIFLFAVVYYIYRFSKGKNRVVWAAITIVISIGIHPNSFILGMCFGGIILFDVIGKRTDIFGLIKYGVILIIGGMVFIGLNILGDENFIQNYSSFGSTLGVNQGIVDKILNLDDFYIKIFNSIGGTYYLPDIRGILISIVVLIIISITVLLVLHKKISEKDKLYLKDSIIGLVGINIALVIIGRYNATSVVFVMPFGYVMLAVLIKYIKKKKGILILLLFIAFSSFNVYTETFRKNHGDYKSYIGNIKNYIKDEDVVLGNLSGGFAFDENKFFDVRNLQYLEKNKITFEEYIKRNGITKIIHYEELQYINRNKEWTILYGDDEYYYEDMMRFIDSKCTLLGSFEDEIYGVRIVRYMDDYPWKVSVYKVK